MSREQHETVSKVMRAISPLRIVLTLWREWFASSGPGRKITLAALYGYYALRMLPDLKGQPGAVEYLVMGLVLVFGGSTLTQGLVKDKLSAGKGSGPGAEPGPSPEPRPPSREPLP